MVTEGRTVPCSLYPASNDVISAWSLELKVDKRVSITTIGFRGSDAISGSGAVVVPHIWLHRIGICHLVLLRRPHATRKDNVARARRMEEITDCPRPTVRLIFIDSVGSPTFVTRI